MRSTRAAAKRRPPVAQRRRWWLSSWLIAGTAMGVIAIVGGLVVLGMQTASPAPVPAVAGSTSQPVVDAATHPDAAALAAVGVSGASNPFVAGTPGSPWVDSRGLPVVFYSGADYCPFCAARRWSLVVALSRFGSFQNLGLTTSSTHDVYPGTNSFSFHGSSYSSDYLDFEGVETLTTDNQPLDALTPEQARMAATFDAPPYTSQANAIPFLDIGNRWISVGGGYSPAVINGMTWQQIASVMRDPQSSVGRAIMADANLITAAICTATAGQPASVCGTPQMSQVTATLAAGGK